MQMILCSPGQSAVVHINFFSSSLGQVHQEKTILTGDLILEVILYHQNSANTILLRIEQKICFILDSISAKLHVQSWGKNSNVPEVTVKFFVHFVLERMPNSWRNHFLVSSVGNPDFSCCEETFQLGRKAVFFAVYLLLDLFPQSCEEYGSFIRRGWFCYWPDDWSVLLQIAVKRKSLIS